MPTNAPTAEPLVDPDLCDRVLAVALRRGGELAELFAEDRSTHTVTLEDGRVEALRSGRERGVGIRVLRDGRAVYAHTTDLSEDGLLAAAAAAAAAVRHHPGDPRVAILPVDGTARAARIPARSPTEVAAAERLDLLRRADDAARSTSPSVRQVRVGCTDEERRILVVTSEGHRATDRQIRTRFSVTCVAHGDTGPQVGTEAPGRTTGHELFATRPPEEVARTAARRAVGKLRAVPAPSGRMPVVLARGAGGVLFHEACGHGLEADLVDRGASVYAGRLGERVAPAGVTLVDDGGLADDWGSAAIDDEGVPVRRNVLIDDGVLVGYLWDRRSGGRAGRASSGNGRRESFRHLPMVRMTNTFLLPGSEDPAEIIRRTPRGLYCVALGGGQVDTATGDFTFGVTEAYLIEDGRVTAPVRDAQLIGNGPATLAAIDAVGSDFDTWAGTCGKDGQGVPVSAGQPTLRVAALTVGGTAT